MDRAKTRIARRVYGCVQGVGFRPFVARIAKTHGISGYVKNCGGYVEIMAEAPSDNLRSFLHDLFSFKGIIDVQEFEPNECEYNGFAIVESSSGDALPPMISPDLPMCKECESELFDKNSRRYRHPFISCAACGARYSVIYDIPYDRDRTSMDKFPLCEKCEREYSDIRDTRHFAQTICCNECGPELKLGELMGDAALCEAVRILKDGGVLALKGAGGYHLACDAKNDDAVRRIRAIKRRERKPLAVMFPTIDAVIKVCHVSENERELLMSDARPIVLLKRKKSDISRETYLESDRLGAFLPYIGYQRLILEETGPIVLTSANASDEPIIFEDDKISDIECDGVLSHNREIITPLDDSVCRVCCDEKIVIRRARGYVPSPIRTETDGCAFAAGGDLKAVFGLKTGGNIYLSQYLGDLENPGNLARWLHERERMKNLLKISPQYAVCDMHPAYHSARETKKMNIPIYQISHHFAHALSVMAENKLDCAIGISFDGTGYGTDGTVWGSEFLLCDRHDFVRLGSLAPFKLLGGDDMARDARKCLVGVLGSCGIDKNVLFDDRYDIISKAIKNNINTVTTTSAGRLFDAASAILGLCAENYFEGACGEAIERAASGVDAPALPFDVCERGEKLEIGFSNVFSKMAEGGNASALAYGFHAGLADAIADVAGRIRARFGERRVVLSGGVFQNSLLLEMTVCKLRCAGFDVYFNREVPLGDGGIAAGQLYWTREDIGCVSQLLEKY